VEVSLLLQKIDLLTFLQVGLPSLMKALCFDLVDEMDYSLHQEVGLT
jgi:hypothetical protein